MQFKSLSTFEKKAIFNKSPSSVLPKYIVFVLVFLLFACTDHGSAILDSGNNDYALYDERGDFHRFSYYNNSEAIVLFVQGNGCPMVRNAITDFHALVEKYKDKGFTFFMINSNLQDHREHILKEAIDFDFQIPVLEDSAQIIADELDITVTAEAIVLDPITREILFRGPINNRLDYGSSKDNATQFYLKDVLDGLLNQIELKEKKIPAKGCKVTRLRSTEEENVLTYTKDIAPLLAGKCVACHNTNGIGPWAMTNYDAINGWSAMIKEVLLSKRMPPWSIDPTIGEFQNSFALEDSSARKIIRWIDEGRVYGEGEDLLASIEPISKEWKAGIPDTSIVLKPEKIPATGIVPYRFQEFTLNLKQDTYLSKIEILPGNAKVVHHINLSVKRKKKDMAAFGRKEVKHVDNYITFSAAENQVTEYPENGGYLIEKDATILVQIHYAVTGKEEEDQTRIGLHYYDGIPEKQVHSVATSNYEFVVPPYGKDIIVKASDTTTRDIKLYYLSPHMHYRGKSIYISVEPPGGKEERIISSTDHNFNWQRFYRLKEPLIVLKGSIIRVEGVFDNTYQNRFNPDPSKELRFGRNSVDEMMIGFYNYTIE